MPTEGSEAKGHDTHPGVGKKPDMRFFVTGTDTGVGKTEVSAALLRGLARSGKRPLAFKPYETGVAARGVPADALRLQRAAGGHQALDTISLFRFEPPLAPGIAARAAKRRAPFSRVLRAFEAFGPKPLVVEGAGGVFVPLDGRLEVIDAIEAMALPVVVVARAGLGTLNHTSLTLEALAARKLEVAGVVLVQGTTPADPSVPFNRPALERRFPKVRFVGPVPFARRAAARERAFDAVVNELVVRRREP